MTTANELERLRDYYNLQDEIRDLDRQAAALFVPNKMKTPILAGVRTIQLQHH